MASTVLPRAPEGCILHCIVCRCRVSRRNGPANAPQALLEERLGRWSPPGKTCDYSTLLALLEGK
eukprot:12808599-Alexandrium_andersonii.AAC.1